MEIKSQILTGVRYNLEFRKISWQRDHACIHSWISRIHYYASQLDMMHIMLRITWNFRSIFQDILFCSKVSPPGRSNGWARLKWKLLSFGRLSTPYEFQFLNFNVSRVFTCVLHPIFNVLSSNISIISLICLITNKLIYCI